MLTCASVICQGKTESAHNTQIKCLAMPTDLTRVLCRSGSPSCVVHAHSCPNTVANTEESSRASHGQDTLQHEKPWKSPDLHFVQTSDVLQSVCSQVYSQPFIISRRRQHFAGLSCSGSMRMRRVDELGPRVWSDSRTVLLGQQHRQHVRMVVVVSVREKQVWFPCLPSGPLRQARP